MVSTLASRMIRNYSKNLKKSSLWIIQDPKPIKTYKDSPNGWSDNLVPSRIRPVHYDTSKSVRNIHMYQIKNFLFGMALSTFFAASWVKVAANVTDSPQLAIAEFGGIWAYTQGQYGDNLLFLGNFSANSTGISSTVSTLSWVWPSNMICTRMFESEGTTCGGGTNKMIEVDEEEGFGWARNLDDPPPSPDPDPIQFPLILIPKTPLTLTIFSWRM